MLTRSNFPPARYGARFSSMVGLGAGGSAETIFLPAVNVRGAILYDATMVNFSSVAGGSTGALLAKASVPTETLDGDLLLLCTSTEALKNGPIAQLPRPVFLLPGLGLYRYAYETGCMFYCSYTLM